MPSVAEMAFAQAIARAARANDRATCVRLLTWAAQPDDTSDTITFADKGGRGMFGRIKDALLGKRKPSALQAIEDHQKKHEEERKKQFPPPDDDDVVDAIPLTAKERFIWEGNPLTMVSSNVHQLRFDKGDGQGKRTRVYIVFKTGDVYVYFDVPWNVVMDEVNTDSPGRGIWRWFREGVKPYKSKYGGRKIGHVELTKAESKPVVVHVIERKPKKL